MYIMVTEIEHLIHADYGVYFAFFSIIELVGQILCCNLPIIFFILVKVCNWMTGRLTNLQEITPNSKVRRSIDSVYWMRLCNAYLLNELSSASDDSKEKEESFFNDVS